MVPANRLFTPILILLAAITSRAESNIALSPEDSIKVRKFVVRSYILVLNTKPSKEETERICHIFSLYESLASNKKTFLDSVLNSKGFYKSILDIYRYEYLQSLDKEQIFQGIRDYKLLLQIKTQSHVFDVFESTLSKIQKLADLEEDLINDRINFTEAHKCFFDNKFYDDLNMGADNMVISSFNYLFFRNPTKYELQESKKMIEGQYGVLFSRLGNSKSDYLDILFSSDAYIEGQVRFWYNKLLYREPSQWEIYSRIASPEKNDLRKLITEILLLNESDDNPLASSKKIKLKSPSAFISIAHLDLANSAIGEYSGSYFENSYHAAGDKSVIKSLIIKSMIGKVNLSASNEPIKKANSVDPDAALFPDCPNVGTVFRSTDALMLCIAVIHIHVLNSKLPPMQGYANFLKWQKENVPNSILGINGDIPDYPAKRQLEWIDQYMKNWARNHPDEYKVVLTYYNDFFGEWSSANNSNSHMDFITSMINELGMIDFTTLERVFIPDSKIEALKDEPEMNSNITEPRQFVIDTYESLLMRKPSEEELNGLIKFIAENKNVTPELLYYSIMTSEEYNFY